MIEITPTEVDVRNVLVKEIPTRTYVTHGLDRYPAKMIPHLARYAIKTVTNESELVLDPFCGCGTVQIESRITGRNCIGIDINPVAVYLARGKSALCKARTLLEHCGQLVMHAGKIRSETFDIPQWLEYWFTPTTLRKLWALQVALKEKKRHMGKNYFDALRAALIVAVRRCCKADPRSPKPFISKRARDLRLGKHFDPFREFHIVVERLAQSSGTLRELISGAPKTCVSHVADSRQVSSVIAKKSIDAVVTSPPYLTAQDYYRSSKLELAILGKWNKSSARKLGGDIIGSGRGDIESDSILLETTSQIEQLSKCDVRAAVVAQKYRRDIGDMLSELRIVLKEDGKCVFVVGDCTIRGIHLSVHEWFVELASMHGFVLTRHLIDTIRDRRVPPQRNGHCGLIRQEHLLFFEVGE